MTLGTVIVGASIGGVRTAQALRSVGYEGEITLVGDERALPYDRPPLSKGLLAGTATPESLTLLSEQEAANLGVRLMLGRAARHLDVAGAFVELVDGERLAYDDVVVATGARPRLSPWGKPFLRWRAVAGPSRLFLGACGEIAASRPGPPGGRRTTGCIAGTGLGPCQTVAASSGRRAGRR